jgi:tripartite-type tricarboxylate transporter receptor subunit TctC
VEQTYSPREFPAAHQIFREARSMKTIASIVYAVVLLAFTLQGKAFAQDYPKRPITIVVPFDAGSSNDRLARGLAQYMAKYLGQPIVVSDKPGGGGQVGTTWLLQQPDDGYTLMLTSASPYIPVNILVTHASYTIDSFAFINALWSDYTILAVAKDRPYQTAADLIAAIKANPGKISAAVDFGSIGHISTLAMLDAMGLKPEALRLVTFDGAGAMRTALAGGQVDFSIMQAQGSDTIKDYIRVLGVFQDHRTPDWDAPPINEALKPAGVTVPLLSGSVRSLVASAAFKTKHPQDFAKVMDAYQKTIADPDFQDWVKKNQMQAEWIGPDRTTDIIKLNFEVLSRYQSLLKS